MSYIITQYASFCGDWIAYATLISVRKAVSGRWGTETAGGRCLILDVHVTERVGGERKKEREREGERETERDRETERERERVGEDALLHCGTMAVQKICIWSRLLLTTHSFVHWFSSQKSRFLLTP